MALQMVSNLNEYLSTTQVGVSLAGILLGWIGADGLATLFSHLLGLTHINHATVVAVSSVLGVLLLTYLEVVLTEIVPKNISIDKPMKMMMFVVTPLHYFHVLFYPFVWLLNVRHRRLSSGWDCRQREKRRTRYRKTKSSTCPGTPCQGNP